MTVFASKTKAWVVGAAAAVLLMAAGPAVPLGPVTLAPHPLSKMYFTAKEVAKQDLADGDSNATLMLASQYLGSAGTGPALFVQVQSARSCGSAGCSVSIYLPQKNGWAKVLDAVGNLTVLAQEHHGMHDIMVGKDDRWAWNGSVYADTVPAPQVDLRPRRGPVHHPARHRGPTHGHQPGN